VGFAREGEFERAAAEFERSLALHPHVATHLNWAQSELERRRWIAGYRQLRFAQARATQHPSEANDEVRATLARRLLDAESRIVQVDVKLLEAPVSLQLNGGRPRLERIGETTVLTEVSLPDGATPAVPAHFVLWLAPGRHELVVQWAQHRQVLVIDDAAGSRRTLALRPPSTERGPIRSRAVPREEARVAASARPVFTTGRRSRKPWRPAEVSAFVVAGAGAVAAGVFGGLALHAKANLEDRCPGAQRCPAGTSALRQDLKQYALLADVSWVVSAVALSTGITLRYTARPAADP
jgi:diadenosine tetraphosphatase ApaH/serine/threonine PP2A family protein phosphatase